MPRTTNEDYDYCTFCNKEVDVEDYGMPISGSDWRCPECKRTSSDLYEDDKGIETRKRNYQRWWSEEEIYYKIQEFWTDCKCDEEAVAFLQSWQDKITKPVAQEVKKHES